MINHEVINLWQSFLKTFFTIEPSAYCFYGIKALFEPKKNYFFKILEWCYPLNKIKSSK